MTEIAKKKFEILEYVISKDMTIDGLSEKLNELTSMVNNCKCNCQGSEPDCDYDWTEEYNKIKGVVFLPKK